MLVTVGLEWTKAMWHLGGIIMKEVGEDCMKMLDEFNPLLKSHIYFWGQYNSLGIWVTKCPLIIIFGVHPLEGKEYS